MLPLVLQLIVLFFCIVVLSRLIASLPAGKVFLYSTLGAVLGGGVVLPCLYITLAANGGSWDYSPTKVLTSFPFGKSQQLDEKYWFASTDERFVIEPSTGGKDRFVIGLAYACFAC